MNRQIDASNNPPPLPPSLEASANIGKQSGRKTLKGQGSNNSTGSRVYRIYYYGSFVLFPCIFMQLRPPYTCVSSCLADEEEEDDLSLSVSLPSGGGGGGVKEGDSTSESDQQEEEERRQLSQVRKGILKILGEDDEEESSGSQVKRLIDCTV